MICTSTVSPNSQQFGGWVVVVLVVVEVVVDVVVLLVVVVDVLVVVDVVDVGSDVVLVVCSVQGVRMIWQEDVPLNAGTAHEQGPQAFSICVQLPPVHCQVQCVPHGWVVVVVLVV